MCPLCFPGAVTPLWQLAQFETIAEWSKRAPSQRRVPWQSPQLLELWIWLADLLEAVRPTWQLAQFSLTTPGSIRAGSQNLVVWQSLQPL